MPLESAPPTTAASAAAPPPFIESEYAASCAICSLSATPPRPGSPPPDPPTGALPIGLQSRPEHIHHTAGILDQDGNYIPCDQSDNKQVLHHAATTVVPGQNILQAVYTVTSGMY